MDAILQAIHKKEKAKLSSLLEDESNRALINNKFMDAPGLKSNTSHGFRTDMGLMHYCIIMDSLACAEVLCDAGISLEIKSAPECETAREMANRIFMDDFIILFDNVESDRELKIRMAQSDGSYSATKHNPGMQKLLEDAGLLGGPTRAASHVLPAQSPSFDAPPEKTKRKKKKEKPVEPEPKEELSLPTNDAPQRATSTGTLNSSAKKPTAQKEEDDATDYQRSQSMVGLKPKTSNPSSPSQPQTSQSVTSLNRKIPSQNAPRSTIIIPQSQMQKKEGDASQPTNNNALQNSQSGTGKLASVSPRKEDLSPLTHAPSHDHDKPAVSEPERVSVPVRAQSVVRSPTQHETKSLPQPSDSMAMRPSSPRVVSGNTLHKSTQALPSLPNTPLSMPPVNANTLHHSQSHVQHVVAQPVQKLPLKTFYPENIEELLNLLFEERAVKGDLTIFSTDGQHEVHSLILQCRCPILDEQPELCRNSSCESVEVLIKYLYLDLTNAVRAELSRISTRALFELWELAINLQLMRLEATVQLFIRNNQSAQTVIGMAKCAKEFNLYLELGATLSFVKSNALILKPLLLQHREVALDLLKAKEEDYPPPQVVVPDSSLTQDLANLRLLSGVTLKVTDPNEEVKDFNVQPRIYSLYSKHFQDLFAKNTSHVINYQSPVSCSTLQSLATFWFTGILSISVIDSLFLLLNLDTMGFKQHDIFSEYCTRRIEEMNVNEFLASLSGLSLRSWQQMVESRFMALFPHQVREFIAEETKIRSSPTVNFLLKKVAALQNRVDELERRLK